MLELTTSVQFVKGIGPRIAEVLAAKGILTVEDLLYYLPFRYEDRTNPRNIAELKAGEMATIIAQVRGASLFRSPRKGRPIFQMTAGQGRNSLTSIWFNAPYLKDKFKAGQTVALYGRVEESNYGRGPFQLMQPQFEILGEPEEERTTTAATAGPVFTAAGLPPGNGASHQRVPQRAEQSLEIGRIVPIYESAGHGHYTARWFRRVIHAALEHLTLAIPDGIPPAVRQRMGLMERREAFRLAHFPDPDTRFAELNSGRTPAHRRLIFEELFFLEVGLELKRRRMRAQPGIAFQINDAVRLALKRILPFHPTGAQKRVLKEIAADMQQPSPMRRLLQGDVGSGKTIVAMQAAVIAIENSYQAALMAPTEILATQHYLSARRLLEPAGYRVVLLTGSLESQQKRDIRRHIAQGNAQLVIGTHALIEEKVEFARPGLIMVDEQHRFGVLQRFKLMKKGAQAEPDVLVMTATPIPRTLALTLYGDLDVSILDEMPPGRTPIITRRIADDRAGEVWAFLRKQVQKGHQAFVVYPAIEEKPEYDTAQPSSQLSLAGEEPRSGLKAAIKMYDELRKRILPDLRIGLLHGKLAADKKEEVMSRFHRGDLDVLVSTTVIEVGVDVPNANLMIVEHAERFGLAQLHQLRGRIGRGSAKSYCVLMTGGKVTLEAERRLDEMVLTTDGFEIAELDLELRGPGEFFGTKQSGLPNFRVANLIRDRDLLEPAKLEAEAVVNGTAPGVSKEDVARVVQHLRSFWQRRYGLLEVG